MKLLDDDFNDYFEPENVPEKKPVEETPEQREERLLKEATIERVHDRKRMFFIGFGVAALLCGILFVWFHFFRPYKVSQQRGVIMEVANEGTFFKTFECKMISESYISDTTRVYTSDFDFTITNDSLALKANELKGTGRRVTIDYEEYSGRVLWRGESHRIATNIELAK